MGGRGAGRVGNPGPTIPWGVEGGRGPNPGPYILGLGPYIHLGRKELGQALAGPGPFLPGMRVGDLWRACIII